MTGLKAYYGSRAVHAVRLASEYNKGWCLVYETPPFIIRYYQLVPVSLSETSHRRAAVLPLRAVGGIWAGPGGPRRS